MTIDLRPLPQKITELDINIENYFKTKSRLVVCQELSKRCIEY